MVTPESRAEMLPAVVLDLISENLKKAGTMMEPTAQGYSMSSYTKLAHALSRPTHKPTSKQGQKNN